LVHVFELVERRKLDYTQLLSGLANDKTSLSYAQKIFAVVLTHINALRGNIFGGMSSLFKNFPMIT
jgi:hypothetical protein